MPIHGAALRSSLHSLRQDFLTHVRRAPAGSRTGAIASRLIKYGAAALFHLAGLTGPLLRRSLRSGRASLILGYHGTTDRQPGYFSSGHAIANVRGQLLYLKRYLRPVPLEEIALPIARGESPPEAAFAVTFDDGLAGNVIHAVPALEDLGVPATFFVPSAFIGSTRDLWVSTLREILRAWPDETIPAEPGMWQALPVAGEARRYAAFHTIKETLKARDEGREAILCRLAQRTGGFVRPAGDGRVVDQDQLRRMTGPGFSVASHTRTHPILSSLDPDAARVELEGSRADLESLVGKPVLDFAYPNGRFGDFSDHTRRLVGESGYRCAVTTEPGVVRRGDDHLALRRCLPNDVPPFLAAFELLTRSWADRRRQGDMAFPLAKRLSCLGPRMGDSAP